MKILIAEDEVVIGDYYKMILESRNHEVVLARDGKECISAFDKAYQRLRSELSSKYGKNPFDLVVLDFRMPGKNGVDVAKHIMSLCPKQKIIFATAYTLDALDGMAKKLKLGVDVFQKPFDLDAFAAMVEDLGQTLPKTS